MTSPALAVDDALVVFDGTPRIVWRGLGGGLQAPVALWPSAGEREQIRRHLARRGPLLVVLSRTEQAVCLLPEEARQAPAELGVLPARDGYFFDLPVPVLDWMPGHLAERGRRFLAACLRRAAAVPGPMLPALLVEAGAGDVERAGGGVDAPARAGITTGAGTSGAVAAGTAGIVPFDDDNVRFACHGASGRLPRHQVIAVLDSLFFRRDVEQNPEYRSESPLLKGSSR